MFTQSMFYIYNEKINWYKSRIVWVSGRKRSSSLGLSEIADNDRTPTLPLLSRALLSHLWVRQAWTRLRQGYSQHRGLCFPSLLNMS
jgi:hypothetical protein